MTTKEKLQDLVKRYQYAKDKGQLQNASEATIRTWIDELLSVFGWNVQNTHQILTEHSLGKEEKEKLNQIGSTNTRPDYTLVNGNVMLAFVDAKKNTIDIKNANDVAFQIRSYGWSIGAPFSIVTNFETLAVYDCSQMPKIEDYADISRICFLKYDEFIDKYEILDCFLSRTNVIAGNLKFVTKKANNLDETFSKMLGDIRKKLAKAILKDNNVEDIKALSFYVQTIINRILFIRVCESRGLEKDELLKDFAQNDFWAKFKTCSYIEFYDRYDGPMFRRITELQNLNIANDVFADFINCLYYPSPYQFNVIPLKTLSDIYDLYLSYQLTMKDGEVADELKAEFKKSNGAVTTPSKLVGQVLQSTMPDSYMSNHTASQLLKLKIIDIACGSGVFLVGVYDYLVKNIEKKILEGDNFPQEYYTILDNKVILTIEGRKAIINNCIFGVDINPEAVEVTKLSLSLKLIDNYQPKDFDTVGLLGSQILCGIGTNIKCGNSLVGGDLKSVCPSIINDFPQIQATNAFDWATNFLEVFANGGFDFVVGNPPYVEVKNYNVGLPCMASYIKTVYQSCKNGKIDLAIPFIEKGIGILNDKGRLGYIIQKRFFKDQYGKSVRKYLTDTSRYLLNGIYDYEESDLFAGRTTYVAIVVCDKNPANNKDVWYINSADSTKSQLLSSETLSETPWNFESAHLNALRMRLSKDLGTLQDVCHVKVGVQVLWNDAFQIVAEKIVNGFIYGHSKIDKNIVVEYDACKPLLCNEQFAPLTKRKYQTFALFPYEVSDNGEVTELSLSEFTVLYPKAGAYLANHKKLICENVQTLPEKNNSYNKREHWHLFTRANNHGAIYQKLCVPMTAQYPQAAVVLDKHIYCDNANMFFIQIDDVNETKLYALAGIINSTIFSTFARSIANPQRGGYFKFNKQFLDPVPVPAKAFLTCNKNIKRLANIAKRIEQINEQIKMSVGGQTSGLELSLKDLWKELDELCMKLYGIKNPEDKALLNSVVRKDRNPYGQES